jgi:hypothetical protein
MPEVGSHAQSKRIPAGTDLAEIFPYARAVKIGDIISRWKEIAKAHRAHFRVNPPAVTVVEVTALMSPEMLVEIEATAVVRS